VISHSTWGRALPAPILFALILIIGRTSAFAQPELDWVRVYGTNDHEACWAMCQTGNHDFALGGSSYFAVSNESGNDAYFILTDSNGDTLFSKAYGVRGYDVVTGVLQVEDGGFLLSGIWSSDAFAMKIDSTGEQVWLRVYEEEGPAVMRRLIAASDGNFLLSGENSADGKKLWLLKINGEGEIIWSRKYGDDLPMWGCKVIETSDGGFAAGGGTGRPNGAGWEAVVLKVDSEGEEEWTSIFGTPRDSAASDQAVSIAEARDGGYMVAGCTKFADGSWQDLIARLDQDGTSCGSTGLMAIKPYK